MEGKNKEFMRALLAEEGLKIGKIDKPKYPQSGRRQRTKKVNLIIRSFPFSPKQKKLLKAFAEKKYLDSFDIKIATESKEPTVLIYYMRKKIKSIQHLKEIIDIKSCRQGKRWVYHLTGMEYLT